MIETWINKNHGIVKRVSTSKDRIEIELPRGGTSWCRNEGFEIGEQVCFSLDPSGRFITKVLPREVAELKVAIAQDETMQHAVMESEEWHETGTVMLDDLPSDEKEVFYNDYFVGAKDGSILNSRSEDENDTNCGGRENREDAQRRADIPDKPIDYYDAIWIDH